MIDIKDAIEQSKYKDNVSNGGSKCFDFDDVVLVKYTCPIKYLKPGEHTRGNSEEIMEAINKKREAGVNTPKHIAVLRVIENDEEICYVLQEKSKGFNCSSKCRYDVSFDRMYSDLKFVFSIPFEHYKKLISDCCQLFEMGYEAKNKNLFYDIETGFWFIDFLTNEKEYMFDPNDPVKLFDALKRRMPQPLQIASSIKYGEVLTLEQESKKKMLEHSIKAKTLLAIKELFPNFEKYEKFFLFGENDDYKRYLMEEGIIKKNLLSLEETDYVIYDELYELVLNIVIDKIVNKGAKFWSVECNDIKNDAMLFQLQESWKSHRENPIKPEQFDDKYDYEYESANLFTQKMLLDIVEQLKLLDQNENVIQFLNDYQEKLQLSKIER